VNNRHGTRGQIPERWCVVRRVGLGEDVVYVARRSGHPGFVEAMRYAKRAGIDHTAVEFPPKAWPSERLHEFAAKLTRTQERCIADIEKLTQELSTLENKR
jgi:hypothetical protein